MTKNFSFSFKNRIAFYYIVSTAILIGLVFGIIFYLSMLSVNVHINDELKIEQKKYFDYITIASFNTYYIRVNQWKEREHNDIDVNPVFVEFYDTNKELIDKSPNLKNNDLVLQENTLNDEFYDTVLNNKTIRQIQTEIKNNGELIGYMIVAMSLDDADLLLILRKILLISFPLIVIILFLVARFIVGRSIKPIKTIINTTNTITRDNFNARIPLPENKDELYQLSTKINELLDRVEKAIEKEKQFTSDASHELRTPLAVIKGTLEVLVRKPRKTEEYNEKISYCVSEVDRLNYLVDQLLLLARFENNKQNIKHETVFVNALLLDSLSRHSRLINEKKLKVITNLEEDVTAISDNYLLSIVFNNLISNAVKYSNENGEISVKLQTEGDYIVCEISDNGMGISESDQEKIFDSFYRSQSQINGEIKGTGIGLSIVKRLCNLMKISIFVSSEINKGTTFTLKFK